MFQPVMAGPAKLDHRPLLQQQNIIRCMRRMTGLTVAFCYGTMRQGTLYHLTFRQSGGFLVLSFCKLLLNAHGIRVALSAEVSALPHHKVLVTGGVRLMTIKAAHFIYQRPMHPVLVQRFRHHVVVASSTHVRSRPLDLEGIGGGGRFMTLVAQLLCHRRMNSVKEYSRCVGAMRIVAGGAARVGHRIVHVGPCKVWPVSLVASHAEGDQIVFEEMI